MPSADLSGLPNHHVVGYIRVSTTEQVPGYSLSQQEARIRHFAAANGLVVAQIFSDPGRSSLHIKTRPGLLDLLRLVQAGGIGGVIIVRDDRLSRKTVQSIQISTFLTQHQTALVILEPLHVVTKRSDTTGIDVRGLMQILAEQEVNQLRQRVDPALTTAASRGIRGGHAPPGYVRLDKEHWATDSTLGPVIAELFRHVAQDGWSPYRCCGALKERGMHRADGKPLTLEQVTYLLRNDWYIGRMTWAVPRSQRHSHGPQIVHASHHPALIDAVLFDQVQSALAIQAYAAAQGMRPGHVPAGYHFDQGQWTIDPTLGPSIAALFTHLAADGWSVWKCQRFLETTGIRRADGKPLTLEQVGDLVRNPWYAGHLPRTTTIREQEGSGGALGATHHPALVNQDVFDQAQAALTIRSQERVDRRHRGETLAADRVRPDASAAEIVPATNAVAKKPSTRGPISLAERLVTRTTIEDLLSQEGQRTGKHGIVPPRIAVCRCGGIVYCTLHTLGPPGHRYKVPKYWCERRRRGGAAACSERPALAEVIDRIVEERLFAAIVQGQVGAMDQAVLPPDIADLERRIRDLQQKIGRLIGGMASGAPADRDRLRMRAQGFESECAGLEKQLERERATGGRPLGPLAALRAQPREAWDQASIQERRRLVACAMHQVIIGDKTVHEIRWMNGDVPGRDDVPSAIASDSDRTKP